MAEALCLWGYGVGTLPSVETGVGCVCVPDPATVGLGLSRSVSPVAERGLGRQDLVPPTQEE